MNILVLMAGSSDAFKEAGYLYPKNLVEIEGLPLVQQVINRLAPLLCPENSIIFLVRQEENQQYHTGEVIRLLIPSAIIVEVVEPTAGAACTALLAIEHILSEEPLLITNGDQIVQADIGQIIAEFQERKLAGGILVFEAVHPRWSYVKCNAEGYVVETAEKRPISNLATAGMYYFAKGSYFVEAAMGMIKKDAHVGNVFYICPSYNEMILKQARIGIYKIPKTAYFSLATPQSVQTYAAHLKSL